MKQLIISFGSVLALLGGFTAYYGFSPKVEKEITEGLEKGDAEKIAAFFAGDVEFSAPGFEDFIPKTEATTRLKDFFIKNAPIGYSPKHGGTSKSKSSNFLIGDLETQTGDFRVNIFLKHGKIEQISFSAKETKSDKNHPDSE